MAKIQKEVGITNESFDSLSPERSGITGYYKATGNHLLLIEKQNSSLSGVRKSHDVLSNVIQRTPSDYTAPQNQSFHTRSNAHHQSGQKTHLDQVRFSRSNTTSP